MTANHNKSITKKITALVKNNLAYLFIIISPSLFRLSTDNYFIMFSFKTVLHSLKQQKRAPQRECPHRQVVTPTWICLNNESLYSYYTLFRALANNFLYDFNHFFNSGMILFVCSIDNTNTVRQFEIFNIKFFDILFCTNVAHNVSS